MMIGMMLPTATPLILSFMAESRQMRGEEGVLMPTVTLALGYITVWTGFSAVATAGQWGLREATLLSPVMVGRIRS